MQLTFITTGRGMLPYFVGPVEDYSSRKVATMSEDELVSIIQNTWTDKYMVRAAMHELACRHFLQLPVEERTDEAWEALCDAQLPF